MRQNCLFDLGRNGVEIRFFFVARIEIEYGIEQITQLPGGHFRDIFVEVDVEISSMRILCSLIGSQLRRGTVRALHLNMFVPFFAMNGTAVDVEMNMVVFDVHVGDMGGITGLHRGSRRSQELVATQARWAWPLRLSA